MKKSFDCVEMKTKAQARIAKQTRGMSPEEELEYFRRGAANFWKDIEALREKTKRQALAKSRRAGVASAHSAR